MFSSLPSYMYDDLQPEVETTETPESHLLQVRIPDGFARSEIGAKVEYDFGRVRVFGERSNGPNKRSRFNINYQVPPYCDLQNIKGKLDGKTIVITMPVIPGAKPVLQETEPKDQGNVDKETPPPQSSTEDNNAAEVKDQKSDQKDPNETSTPQDEQKVPMPQKGQEEISQKGDVAKVESKGQEATQDSIPQKGQEKAAATKDAKLQAQENNTAKLNDENKEKHSFQKEETKDHLKKITPAESEKQHVVDDSPTHEKEIKEESKGSKARVDATTTKYKKGKEMNGNIGDDSEKKSDIKGMTESSRTRIRDMAAYTTKAVTSLAKRLNEDDKQKLIYTGAAILVVGLSVYASYKYRSSHKP